MFVGKKGQCTPNNLWNSGSEFSLVVEGRWRQESSLGLSSWMALQCERNHVKTGDMVRNADDTEDASRLVI